VLEKDLGKLAAIAALLTALSFLVVQNSVQTNIRVAYFIGHLNDVSIRLGNALLLSAFVGFGLGFVVARWRC
jgi:hypothetical protein